MSLNWPRLVIYAAVVAGALAGAAWVRSHFIGQGVRQGEATVQGRWDAQKRVDLAETLALERERNADQLLRFKNAERNTDEQARREALRAGRDRAAADERGRMLATIATLNRRQLPTTCDSACAESLALEGSTARELLGSCTTRYQSVAAAADELRDQVIGLQADALGVCRASTPSTAFDAPATPAP